MKNTVTLFNCTHYRSNFLVLVIDKRTYACSVLGLLCVSLRFHGFVFRFVRCDAVIECDMRCRSSVRSSLCLSHVYTVYALLKW